MTEKKEGGGGGGVGSLHHVTTPPPRSSRITSRPIVKFLNVLLAFIQAGLTSGIIFGWPSLEIMFITENVYAEHCPKEERSPCCNQILFYNMIYTIGIFANNGSPLITGFFLDQFGPKLTNMLSSLLFFIGCALFYTNANWSYVVGFALLGFAGPGVYVSIMHLSNLFPNHQSLVLSFFSGTFSVSSLIFRVFLMLYTSYGLFTLQKLFVEFIIVCTPFFVVGYFVWPNRSYRFQDGESGSDSKPLLHSSADHRKIRTLYNAPVKTQLSSAAFWLPVIWLAFQALHIHTYLGTVATQFSGQDNYVAAFNWIWICGFVCIPFFGTMLDKFGEVFSFFVCSGMLLLVSIFSMIPVLKLQYITFVLLSTSNVGIWGMFYTYLSKEFGFTNYGKLLGVACGLIASVGLLQYGILYIVLNYLEWNFLYMNGFFTGVSVLLFIPPTYLYMQTKHRRTRHFIQ